VKYCSIAVHLLLLIHNGIHVPQSTAAGETTRGQLERYNYLLWMCTSYADFIQQIGPIPITERKQRILTEKSEV